MKTPRTFKELINDPRIKDYSDERVGQYYGIWLYLSPGWVTDEGLLTIHEWSVKDCVIPLKHCRYSPEEYIGALGESPSNALLLPGN